jgi:uncharacterized RDD family membrane protein YckC
VESSANPFLDFGQDTLRRDGAAVDLAPAAASGPTAYGTAPSREDSEDALHSRLNAAVIDQILVNLLIVGLALGLGMTFASTTFLAFAVALELVYFFVQETASGQTIGKRRCGVRVINLDGTVPGPRAIAFRTLGRVLDALPAYHASGLLTMIGTGRRRRQRIGDYIARTTVVAAPGGRALAPRRRWLLPLLTVVATVLSAALIVSAVQRAENSTSFGNAFVSGCERAGSTPAYCGCVYDAFVAAGYTTTAAWDSLEREASAARASGNPGLLPPVYFTALRDCRTR